MKLKTIYVCTNCGVQANTWSGKCNDCNSWGTLTEDVIDLNQEKEEEKKGISKKAFLLSEINIENIERIKTNIKEVDRVFGGGLVPNSLSLFCGEPGIGKTTILLQICSIINEANLYISGEESKEQIAIHLRRMGINNKNTKIMQENNLENIIETIKQNESKLIIIDSIQTITSSNIGSINGSIQQIKYCTEKLMQYAKKNNIAIILVGHVTKDGNLAGPKILEHLVDTVIYFEGERKSKTRILRSIKNRFGSTLEIGLFEMTSTGIQEKQEYEIDKTINQEYYGTSHSISSESSRPIIIELQALVNITQFGYPKRTTSGYDLNKLNILLAILEKYLKIPTNKLDCYLNIVNGFKTKDPNIDLATLLAIYSSYKKRVFKDHTLAIGEISLTGEVLADNNIQSKLQLAQKLGFKKIIISSKNRIKENNNKLEIIKVKHITELKNIFSI